MQQSSTSSSTAGRYHRSGINQILVLLGLTGFAITEPLLTIFGASPDLFYFHNTDSPALIIIFALVVALLPALGCRAITAVAGVLNRGFGTVVHYIFVGLISALWFIQFAKWNLELQQSGAVIAFALLGSIAFVLAYLKWAPVNALLQVTAIAPLIALGVFLLSSDTGKIMRKVETQVSLSVSGKSHPSVLFVILDEFPTMTLFDENASIDKKRFPNLHALSQQATWYRHYSVLSDKTDISVPTILTGNLPRPERANMTNFPDNLFTLLAPTHRLTVFENLTQLCELPQCSEGSPDAAVTNPPPEMGALLSKTAVLWLRRITISERGDVRRDDFQEKLASPKAKDQQSSANAVARLFDPAYQAGVAKERPERLQKFIETFVADSDPTLYFLHIQMPHSPWRFFPSGQLYDLPFTRPPTSPDNTQGGEWVAKLSEYRYLLQAQYTDQLLGEIFSRMKSLGLWDPLLVVVTADHGYSFQLDTSSRHLQPSTLSSIAYSPLVIKRPFQQSGAIDNSNVMAHDLLPTIAEILDITVPWKVAGYPAGHSGIEARNDQKIYFPKQGKFFSRALGAEHSFSDKEHFPDFSSRWIGALHNPDDPLSLLNGALGLDQFLNRQPSEFNVVRGGDAIVDELAVLRDPPAERTPLGVIIGNLTFDSTADKVLISVNGRFVTGSPLLEFLNVKNTFIAMLPESAVATKKEIGVYLVDGDTLVELGAR